MIIYTINNIHSNYIGAFTITANDVNSLPIIHYHIISNISQLENTINSKAPINHTHVMVNNFSIYDNSTYSYIKFYHNINIDTSNELNIQYQNGILSISLDETISNNTKYIINQNLNNVLSITDDILLEDVLLNVQDKLSTFNTLAFIQED
jgi:hypothetical protein